MRERRHAAWFVYGVIAIVLVAPMAVWWNSVGDPSVYFTRDLPPGQGLYAFAKLAGLLGLAFFWAQALLGMAPHVPLFRGVPAISRRGHIRLGLVTAVLVATHVALFVIGSSLRKKTVAWDLLLPNLDHGFYFQSITLGAFALYLLVLALVAGWRVHRGARGWKPLHMLWGAVFVLALTHSLAIGSESRTGVLGYVFFFIGSSLGLIALTHATIWLRRRRGQESGRARSRSVGVQLPPQ